MDGHFENIAGEDVGPDFNNSLTEALVCREGVFELIRVRVYFEYAANMLRKRLFLRLRSALPFFRFRDMLTTYGR